jgi:hypothetical protein
MLSLSYIFSFSVIFCLINLVDGDIEMSIRYPVKLMLPVTGSVFNGVAEKDYITCFGNQDYMDLSFIEALGCLTGILSDGSRYGCYGLWGSRMVSVSVDDSIEFYRLHKLPREITTNPVILNATHWLHLNADIGGVVSMEMKQADAGPLYLCARSNNWKKTNTKSNFNVIFRSAYIRQDDRENTLKGMILLIILICNMSIVWLFPYITSIWSFVMGYYYGLNIFILLFSISIMTLFLTPFIITKR